MLCAMHHRRCQPLSPLSRPTSVNHYDFADERSPPSSGQVPPTRQDLEWLFAKLFGNYGPREWWPTVHGGDFELVIGAILVQNVSWKSTKTALTNLLEAGIWSFDAILSADDADLHRLIRPTVYWRMKTRKLKEFAHFITETHGGSLKELFALETGEMRRQLLGVWGIGPETADDIILYGAGQPSFVIDAYTKRLLKRLGFEVKPETYETYQELFHRSLPDDADLFNEYHALIDYHSANVCKARPLCTECVLAGECPIGLGLAQP